MDQNLIDLITKIKDTASDIVNKDITSVRGFSERQVEAIAKQTLIIQQGVLTGEIDSELKEFFFDGLEAMTLNFANTLKGMLTVTVEKLWNSIVEVLWEAVDTAT